MERSARQYWDRLALRWRISSPLAPAGEDVAWFERQVAGCATGKPPMRALLLGVTAAIATMRWPESTRLLAADWSSGMLRNVWPSRGTPRITHVICADWRELPLASASIDLAIGDGCYTALGKIAEVSRLSDEIRRVLRPGATLVMRCFCRPAAGLRIESLFEQLLARQIENLDLFRWLLAMAVHGQSTTGVSLREVWEQWARRVPDARALQARLGWSEDSLTNMEGMSTATMTYCFPTLDELVALGAPTFELVASDPPRYPWGELFPRLVLRAR